MVILSTGSLYPYGLNRIFEIASVCKFDGVELLLRSNGDGFYDTRDKHYLKKLKNEYNLDIPSLHVPFEFEEKPDNFNEIIDLATSVQGTSIVLHIPRVDQSKYITWFLETYSRLSTTSEINLLAENIHIKEGKANPIYSSVDEFKKLPNMVFDIAHALRSGQDPLSILSKLKNVRQLHISDWNGIDDHMGILDRKEYFAKILSIRSAIYCLELCPKAFKDFRNINEIIDTLTKTVSFIKNI